MNCQGFDTCPHIRDLEEEVRVLKAKLNDLVCEKSVGEDDSDDVKVRLETDGIRYRKCIAWRVHGGCGHACFEMCDEKQRSACKDQHTTDKGI